MKQLSFIFYFITNFSFSQISTTIFIDKYGTTFSKNEVVLKYISEQGRTLAPDYDKVNCTDFLIKVLGKYYKLSVKDLQQISIFITDKNDIYNFNVYLQNIYDNSNFYNGRAKFIYNHKVSTCCGMADMEGIYQDISKGVVQWMVDSKKGVEIDFKRGETPIEGDFVQFWKVNGFGHCGILKSIDIIKNKITLYSSFPSTKGYGVQEFDLPENVYFGRLK